MQRLLKYTVVLLVIFSLLSYVKSSVYAANECDPGGGKPPVNAGDSVCVYTDTQGEWVKTCQADGSFTEPTKCIARCVESTGKCEVINSPTPAPTIPGEQPCNSPIGTIGRGKQQCRTGFVYQCPAGNGKTDADQINCTASGSNRTCTDTTSDQPLKSAGESCVDGTTNLNPTPTPGGAEEVPEVPSYGQFIPKPAENCGIPVEDKIPPATQVDATDTRHACCYSWMADRIKIPDSANFADGIPGVDKLLGAIIAALNGMIDNFPFFINPFGALNELPVPTVGKVKSWLLSTEPCVAGFPSTDKNKPGCVCTRNIGAGSYDADKICNTITDAEEKKECRLCVGFNPGEKQLYKFDGVWTTLGCINVSENGFIQSLISLGVQLGGGTVLLCIMYAAFLLQTSQGSPERIKKARDLMTSCITGLLLILFAVFILRVIGYDILRIPGLG